MLLLDANLHTLRLCTLPELVQILETFTRSPGKSDVGRRGVKDEQSGLADDREAERTIERSLTGLLEIHGAQNA